MRVFEREFQSRFNVAPAGGLAARSSAAIKKFLETVEIFRSAEFVIVKIESTGSPPFRTGIFTSRSWLSSGGICGFGGIKLFGITPFVSVFIVFLAIFGI